MTPDDLEKLMRAAKTAPAGYDTVADIHLDDALRNLAPALLRLWRAASREANTPTIRRLRDYEIDAALHELEAHRP